MSDSCEIGELVRHQRILQFKFSRDSSLVQDAYKSLIMSALFEREANSIADINKILFEKFCIQPLPFSFLKKYLTSLREEGKVSFDKGQYELAKSEKKELEETAKKRIEVKNLINTHIIERIKSTYSLEPSEEEKLIDIFNEIISCFFTNSARIFSGYLLESKKLIFNVPTIETVIDEKAHQIQDLKLRAVFKESIEEELKKETVFLYESFYDIFQTYICFEILSIDPKMKIDLGVKRVYLDTNFLLDLLLPFRKMHNIAVDCIKLSKEMNIKNIFHNKTSLELINLIREYKTAENLSESVFNEIAKSDDGLILAFTMEKRQNPSLTFEGYCIGIEKSFRKQLDEKYAVRMDNTKYPEVELKAKEMVPIINIAAHKVMHQYKSKFALEHDAFCLELLKTKKDSLFVTGDNSLFYISKMFIEQGKISKPLSVEKNVWLSALTFVRPPRIEKASIEAFKEFMIAPLTSSLKAFSMNKVIAVAFPWLKDEFLTPKDMEEIISRKFLEDHIIKPQTEQISSILTTDDIIPEIVDQKLKEKISQLKEENVALEQKTKQVLAEKEKVEKKYLAVGAAKIKNKPLFVIGLLSFVSLIIFVFLTAFLKVNIPDVAFYSFTAITVIFIGASIFGENVYKYFKMK